MRDTGVLSDGEPTRIAGGRGPSRAEGETGGSISAGALPDPEHSEPGGAGVRGRALSGESPRGARGARAEPSGRRGSGIQIPLGCVISRRREGTQAKQRFEQGPRLACLNPLLALLSKHIHTSVSDKGRWPGGKWPPTHLLRQTDPRYMGTAGIPFEDTCTREDRAARCNDSVPECSRRASRRPPRRSSTAPGACSRGRRGRESA